MPTTTPATLDASRVPAALPLAPWALPLAWALALGVVAATRWRGEWSAYRAFHRGLADLGVPDGVRNLDSMLIALAAAAAGAGAVALTTRRPWWAWLGLTRGRPGWSMVVLASLLPMVLGGLALAAFRWPPESATTPSAAASTLWRGVVRAPIVEEVLFRGLLIGVVAAALGGVGAGARRGVGFWLNAAAAAALFAVTHVAWTAEGFARGWPTLLVTGAGGAWYVWLLARWGTLWPSMLLHAGMNLGWMLASAGGSLGGAGGGGWIENLLRAATITAATWWTVTRTRAA